MKPSIRDLKAGNRNHLVTLAFGLVALVGSGCASIISGSKQQISVNSNINNAEVYLDGELLGKTPLTLKVKRGKEGPLVVKADGYEDYSFAINKSINSVFWVNILIGGTLGSSTDYSSGAMYEYEPSTFFADLTPQNASEEVALRHAKVATLRRFLLVNQETVVRQIAVGEGTHLEALLQALEVSEQERGDRIASWQRAYAEATDAVDFATRLIATSAI